MKINFFVLFLILFSASFPLSDNSHAELSCNAFEILVVAPYIAMIAAVDVLHIGMVHSSLSR